MPQGPARWAWVGPAPFFTKCSVLLIVLLLAPRFMRVATRGRTVAARDLTVAERSPRRRTGRGSISEPPGTLRQAVELAGCALLVTRVGRDTTAARCVRNLEAAWPQFRCEFLVARAATRRTSQSYEPASRTDRHRASRDRPRGRAGGGGAAAVGSARCSLRDVIIAAAFYLVTGFGVTVGYHRLFTHRSFRPARWLKIVLASTGSLAVEGSLDRLGREPPPPPRVQRPARRPALAARARHRRRRPAPRLRARARRLAVQGRPHVGRALRARSARRRRHRVHQPALPAVRDRLARGAVLPRLDALGRDRRRAHRAAVGRARRAWCCCTT